MILLKAEPQITPDAVSLVYESMDVKAYCLSWAGGALTAVSVWICVCEWAHAKVLV